MRHHDVISATHSSHHVFVSMTAVMMESRKTHDAQHTRLMFGEAHRRRRRQVPSLQNMATLLLLLLWRWRVRLRSAGKISRGGLEPVAVVVHVCLLHGWQSACLAHARSPRSVVALPRSHKVHLQARGGVSYIAWPRTKAGFVSSRFSSRRSQ